MKNKHSWTRENYKLSYRWMRRGWDIDTIAERTGMELEILQAADYSYQAFGCEPHGWSSHRRYRAFLHMKCRVLTHTEDIPF